MKVKNHTYDEVRELVKEAVFNSRLTRKKWAELHKLNYTYLNHFMVKDCAPPPEILEHFGLVRAIIKKDHVL